MSLPQLQTYSAFSLLKSTLNLKDYVSKGKSLGYEVLALSDEGQLSAMLAFCRLAQNENIQPLIAMSLKTLWEGVEVELLLYVRNQQGYENLFQLSTDFQLLGVQNLEKVLLKTQGLAVVLPFKNLAYDYFLKGNEKKAQEFLHLFKEDFYVGLSPLNTTPVELLRLEQWRKFLQKEKIKEILVHPVSYLEEEDAFPKEVLEALDKGEKIDVVNTAKTGEDYLYSQEEFLVRIKENHLEDLISPTEAFGKSFHFLPPKKQKLLPHYPLENQSAEEKLQELAEKNLARRVENYSKEYEERLHFELSVINEMGFADYFLIVWDVMNYCHSHHIATGAGRGSAAGSLVAYVLEITDIDPLKYQLLFERFLNPERKTMPDIDLDIPDLKREEVLQYVAKKYGSDQVAQIATFGTMAAKMVLRDVSRVFGLTQREANAFSKAIPGALKITLKESYEKSYELRQLVNKNELHQLLFKTALKLEGLPRHVSTHAAGVVIGDGPLVKWVPLQKGSNTISLTQFTMGDVEGVGLLKMDFLGLKNLTILQETTENVSRLLNRPFSVRDIPLEDEKTLELFQKGETAGVFQFESPGIRRVLKKVSPNSFEEVAAVNALYRPGPMENIDTYVKRKNGLEPITYPDDSVKDILSNTYGIIVYQEQVMQVANKLAGFSLGQADILRRAVSKKKKELIDEQRENFVKGALKEGHSKKVADEVYDYIERFANYGFGRAHAFAYSVVAFQLAFYKVHYPQAFYPALLNSVSNNDGKLKSYLGEAKQRGIKIFGPDINASYSQFSVNKKGIRYGLSKIKGLRRDFIKEILTERKNAPYTSLDDFLFRLDNKWLKEETIAPLIMVGAFDNFDPNRRLLLTELSGKIKNVIYSAGSLDLLELMTLKREEVEDFSLRERLNLEEEYLGTFLSGHPLEETLSFEKKYHTTHILDYEVGQKVRSFVYVKEIKKIRTKKGEQMAFLTVQDLTGETSLTVFPLLFRKIFSLIQLNGVYLITGKVEKSNYQEQLQVLLESLETFEQIKEDALIPRLFLKVPNDSQVLQDLQELIHTSLGKSPVILLREQKVAQELSAQFKVSPTEEFLEKVTDLLGKENVFLQK